MRSIDSKKREREILDLVLDSYIEESRPISSSYLCEKFHLPFSSATVRNVLESLEKKGFLSHIHTSSGRVPTQLAFRHYAQHLDREEISKDTHVELMDIAGEIDHIDDVFDKALKVLSDISGYTSLIGIWGIEEKLLFRRTRFILEQPEFEDINKLRDLFYALEVKIYELQDLLFTCIDQDLKILIGDDIGCKEISECSLITCGFKEKDLSLALALLGPMRMNYIRACNSLYSIKNSLQEAIKEIV